MCVVITKTLPAHSQNGACTKQHEANQCNKTNLKVLLKICVLDWNRTGLGRVQQRTLSSNLVLPDQCIKNTIGCETQTIIKYMYLIISLQN